ncbi:MAG: hypothetical protein KF875_06560 [Trueperaceae bacterium]|nr:hypothetical protein [Trueperaceae bacterium]MCC6309402.1 hypothetical protein [Trueperaceae bacterium]MCW5819269.1 hypothetical protein [Trueperaceae bacterium]
MTRRTLIIASLAAAVAFAGGNTLMGAMRPGTASGPASDQSTDPTKVVATPGSALVPVNGGEDGWMLVGPDGTVLAGPDGRPPATPNVLDAGAVVGIAAAFDPAVRTGRDTRDGRGSDCDEPDRRHDDDDHDDDYDDHDDDHDREGLRYRVTGSRPATTLVRSER